MGATESGNLTFVIDADTGRALQKLAQTAAGMDNVKKKTKDMGDEGEKSGKKLEMSFKAVAMRMQSTLGIGGVALGAGMGAGFATASLAIGEKIYQYFVKKSEEAKKHFESVIKDAGKIATGSAGQSGVTANRAAALKKLTGLSEDVTAKGASALLKVNPGASNEQLAPYIKAGADLQPTGPGSDDLMAQLLRLGIDPQLAAGIIEKSGNRAGDVATYAKRLKMKKDNMGNNSMMNGTMLGDFAGRVNTMSPALAGNGINKKQSDWAQMQSYYEMSQAVPETDAVRMAKAQARVDGLANAGVTGDKAVAANAEQLELVQRMSKAYPNFNVKKFMDNNGTQNDMNSFKDSLIGEVSGGNRGSKVYDEVRAVVYQQAESAKSFERAAKSRSNDYTVDAGGDAFGYR
jgi:hypothetical protein